MRASLPAAVRRGRHPRQRKTYGRGTGSLLGKNHSLSFQHLDNAIVTMRRNPATLKSKLSQHPATSPISFRHSWLGPVEFPVAFISPRWRTDADRSLKAMGLTDSPPKNPKTGIGANPLRVERAHNEVPRDFGSSDNPIPPRCTKYRLIMSSLMYRPTSWRCTRPAIFVWLAGTPQLAADTVLRPLQEIFDVIIHIAWATVPFSTGILSCSTDPPHGKLTVRALRPRR